MNEISSNTSILYKEFLERLPYNIRDLYQNNVKEKTSQQLKNEKNTRTCYWWIDKGFVWDKTEEHTLWSKLFNVLADLPYSAIVNLLFIIKDFNLQYEIKAQDYILRKAEYRKMVDYFKTNGISFIENDCEITYTII
jgi:hypothetical protein